MVSKSEVIKGLEAIDIFYDWYQKWVVHVVNIAKTWNICMSKDTFEIAKHWLWLLSKKWWLIEFHGITCLAAKNFAEMEVMKFSDATILKTYRL